MSYMILFDPKEDILKFSCLYLYQKCVRNGDNKGGFLEDVKGSGLESWRTEGPSLTLWMYLEDPKDRIL